MSTYNASQRRYYFNKVKPRRQKEREKRGPKFTMCKKAWGRCPFCSTIRPADTLMRPGDLEIRAVFFGGRGYIVHQKQNVLSKQIKPLFDKAYTKYFSYVVGQCISFLRRHFSNSQIKALFRLDCEPSESFKMSESCFVSGESVLISGSDKFSKSEYIGGT